MATLTIEVTVFDNDATAAKKKVDMRVTEYFDFLKKKGLDHKDINAANLRTQPEYDYKKTGEAVHRGYRALRHVQVTVHQLDTLNALLEGALKLGLNEIRTVEFGVADSALYREQVRQKAIADAVQQAHSLTQGFKVQLGPVFSIRYLPGSHQSVPLARMHKTADVATSAQQTYEQQTIHFDDHVEVVFELRR